MAFFKREPSPVERFETALKLKQAERQKLAARSVAADRLFAEKRAAAEQLAVAGAANAKLERAEAKMRSVEDQARTLRTELAELDEQIVATERALADARAQRDRELVADQIEALASSVERAIPGFGAGAAALIESITGNPAQVVEATRFAARYSRPPTCSAGSCGRLRSARAQATPIARCRRQSRPNGRRRSNSSDT
jgi:predicted  nucleic acid-binding Zn-ribbon protein